MMRHIVVIGYSVDAFVKAAELASQDGASVEIMVNGEPGAPLDDLSDLVSAEDSVLLGRLAGDLSFTSYFNPEAMYIPYGSLQFRTNQNGLMGWPVSEHDIADAGKWSELCAAAKEIPSGDAFVPGDPPSKLLTAYRGCLPKWFFDSVVKPMSVTRWKGVPVADLTMQGFSQECRLDGIEKGYVRKNAEWMRPSASYKDICGMIAGNAGVRVSSTDARDIAGYIRDCPRIKDECIIMDNRIDQYLDYMCGVFDREIERAEPAEPIRELAFADGYFARTPTMDCWAVAAIGGISRRYTSERPDTLGDGPVSVLPLTRNNIKVYSDYADQVRLYGGKTLDLCQKIRTLVK